MRKIIMLALTLPLTSFAAINDINKAAHEICLIEWNITDKVGSTDRDVLAIVNEEVSDFKERGFSLLDFGIDEPEYIATSARIAESFRRDHRPPNRQYDDDIRDTLRELMVPRCVTKVKESLTNH
ncbi:hypothetical protein EXT68_04925 [Pectobacterium parmentieri]|uniref:Uncharacterized protein n=2 Tax=Pectobacterium parmentieri TaxID=1905730 RepID=A0A0H3I275_PECPM|nr:hypothetical protein [Pectobacterium parmentieri]AFI90162.1 Hypothetical protein W5S_2073 [Pectobacterium parmentieri]MBI0471416.1 hypothetical protein [Pectobacterium parmentieri]MBI0494028.1 hypothetical protein [Pectobacterium parmentieri]MBI0555323.1 hypothetical protein [Pectobacterium parmentieri]MBI0568357.1 hypothetical protein [Pectobacterium parmentieri]